MKLTSVRLRKCSALLLSLLHVCRGQLRAGLNRGRSRVDAGRFRPALAGQRHGRRPLRHARGAKAVLRRVMPVPRAKSLPSRSTGRGKEKRGFEHSARRCTRWCSARSTAVSLSRGDLGRRRGTRHRQAFKRVVCGEYEWIISYNPSSHSF